MKNKKLKRFRAVESFEIGYSFEVVPKYRSLSLSLSHRKKMYASVKSSWLHTAKSCPAWFESTSYEVKTKNFISYNWSKVIKKALPISYRLFR